MDKLWIVAIDKRFEMKVTPLIAAVQLVALGSLRTVAQFARLTGDLELMTYCRERFKTVLVPEQIAADGSFPQELRRIVYMYPYIKEKQRWPLRRDVMYADEWPMRQISLLFAGRAFRNAEYLNLWKTLKADSTVDEVNRNFFIRQPVLWVN